MLLASHPFLRGLPADDVARLADATEPISLPAGHRLFEQGSRAEKFWLITSGQVALDLQCPGRAPVIVETIGAGEVIGISWLSPPFKWEVGARATEPVTGFEIDGRTVMALCDSEPLLGYRLTRRMLAVVSRRLQATRRRLLDAFGDDQPEGGVPRAQ